MPSDEELASAADLVERELRRLRVSLVEFEYSDGCSLSGSKSHLRAVSLATCLLGVRKKV